MFFPRSYRAAALLIIVGLLYATGFGCSSCDDKTVHSERHGDMEVAIHHRVCGSVAVYTVSVAPPGEPMLGRADLFEPFSLVCDCYQSEKTLPVQVRVTSPDTMLISYDIGRAWQVRKQRPTQGKYRITYKPYGAKS